MTHDHGLRVKAALADLGSSKPRAAPRRFWTIYLAIIVGLVALALAAGMYL